MARVRVRLATGAVVVRQFMVSGMFWHQVQITKRLVFFFSCSCLTALPGPAQVVLSKTYKPFSSPLEMAPQGNRSHTSDVTKSIRVSHMLNIAIRNLEGKILTTNTWSIHVPVTMFVLARSAWICIISRGMWWRRRRRRGERNEG